MSELQAFLSRAGQKARDDVHRRTIMKAIKSFDKASSQMKGDQFIDWQAAREQAALLKDDALRRLPDLLEQFEQNAKARGVQVLWAETAEQARDYFRQIIDQHRVRKVVKSKSMATEEIELNPLFEKQGIEVFESDLGELIVQVAQEKPYHIIAPAIHKTKEEIARLFHERLGTPLTDSPEELTMFARQHLRRAYLEADLGVTGGNFLIADTGAIVVTENEGNARLTMACPPVHVALVGIEKVLARMSDLAFFLPLLATAATGQQITCYNSITRGPAAADEGDGPKTMYVILLDNGRSRIYAQEVFRHSLRCIRCGACLNVCPVYQTIGGHSYNTAYQGPIGSVITPHLRGLRQWGHLSAASSLCGACSDICPVHIDLHHLLLKNRAAAIRTGSGGLRWRLGMWIWAYVMQRRERLRRLRILAQTGQKLLPLFFREEQRRHIPVLSQKTFADLWRDQEE